MPFSVLMSLYIKEVPDYFRQSLDSVFNQTLKPDEIILVKDGPVTEQLDDVIREYKKNHPELIIVPLAKNGGLGKALNEGLKHCSYEIVARMDTDDIAKPDRFEKQMKLLDTYPQADVVSAWIEEFRDTPDNIISTRRLPEFPYEIYRFGKKRCPINHPVVMFRKKAILFAGGYLPFPLFEDYYLWIRLLLNGAKFYNIQESLLLFRTSSDMYRRRGGFKHAINEIQFQHLINRLGYISKSRFIFNIIIRFTTRIMPNNLRAWVYMKLLRK